LVAGAVVADVAGCESLVVEVTVRSAEFAAVLACASAPLFASRRPTCAALIFAASVLSADSSLNARTGAWFAEAISIACRFGYTNSCPIRSPG
jgi:hypothetical protein